MNSTYLERRLSVLIKKFEEGKIFFNKELLEKEDGNKLINELSLLKRKTDGSIDISSATPFVRSFARIFYNIDKINKIEEKKADEIGYQQNDNIRINDIIEIQREYLSLLEDFFISATGNSAEKFLKNNESFYAGIQRRKNNKFVKNFFDALNNYMPKISEFHSKKSNTLLKAHELAGGLKCFIGGSSRFPEAAFDGFRKFSLYADTIFIPDPILPWLEIDRGAERFRDIHLLHSCYYLLKLKPLIDKELPYPPVIIFPSWEKSLESSNEETKDLISDFIINFFSFYLKNNFEDESEIIDYISNNGKEKFREIVISQKLFLPPNSKLPNSFDEASSSYLEFINQERSKEFIKLIDSWTPEYLIFNGILERIIPQFHVRDNTNMLEAHPLFWLPTHYHYFLLCSKVSNNELNQMGFIDSKTLSILQGLQHPSNSWLGNLPISEIARLRAENCNETFRKRLSEYFSSLSNANFENLNSVAAEIGRAISSLISEHDIEAKKIEEKYFRKNIVTSGISILTLGVLFAPWLAPYLGSYAIFGPIGKFAYDKFNQIRDKKLLNESFFGVLSNLKG